jgi:hypothetical protein
MNRNFSQSVFNLGVCLALLVLVCSGCQLMMGTKSFDDQSTAKVEEVIKENPLFREFDNLCSEMPLPNDFRLLGKNGLYKIKGISYFYESNAKPIDVEKFFKKYFSHKGWKVKESRTIRLGNDFTDGKYKVTIYYSADDSDYTIYCGLLEGLDKEAVWNDE